MKRQFHSAFTLVELLIVIAIIATLAGIMLVSMGGGTEAARAAQCLSNMKNLANACQSYGAATKYYPLAGSVSYVTIDESDGIKNAKKTYNEVKGWISWMSEGVYPATGSAPGSPMSLGFMSEGTKQNLWALQNGAVWDYVGGNRSTYVCPSHVNAMKGKGVPLWSYLMNARFRWDSSQGYVYVHGGSSVRYGSEARADRILLFSEIPFRGPGNWFPSGEGNGMEDDAILQYDGCDKISGLPGRSKRNGEETIGCNHPMGKSNKARAWFAHVVFADGHTEKINVTDVGDDNLKKLTTYLCTGVDYAIDGNGLREL